MRRSAPFHPVYAASLAVALLASACATTSAGTASVGTLAVGAQATVDGRVTRVDTGPWTYDGNAVLGLASDANGAIEVQFPARWNLCKAAPVDVLQTLKPGDRVRVTGSVSAPGQLSVCERVEHGLRRLD